MSGFPATPSASFMYFTNKLQLTQHLVQLKRDGAWYWTLSSAAGGTIRGATGVRRLRATPIGELLALAELALSSAEREIRAENSTIEGKYGPFAVSLHIYKEHASMSFRLS